MKLLSLGSQIFIFTLVLSGHTAVLHPWMAVSLCKNSSPLPPCIIGSYQSLMIHAQLARAITNILSLTTDTSKKGEGSYPCLVRSQKIAWKMLTETAKNQDMVKGQPEKTPPEVLRL